MKSIGVAVKEYIASLPADRKDAISTIRNAMLSCLPEGYEEVLHGDMIRYQVPLAKYPNTYNKEPLMYAGLSSQKNHMAIYFMSLYVVPKFKDQFVAAYKKVGKKPDMGASCVRFKSIDEVPVELIGEFTKKIPMKKMIAFAKTAHKK
jgi:uncharacterized protein YdhG (YjbR/CyaY superfamily)